MKLKDIKAEHVTRSFCIFAVLLAYFVFTTKYINASGFEDFSLRSKSTTLNDAGFNFNNMEAYKNTDLKDLQNEIWKDLKGYKGKYKVSNLGRIKSLHRAIARKSNIGNKSYVTINERILTQRIRSSKERPDNKYLFTRLYKNKTQKTYMSSRLIALNFVPNPKNKPQVNHKDGRTLDNEACNLEWMTPSENTQHAYDNGLIKKTNSGESCYLSKLKEKDVIKIRKLYKPYIFSASKIARIYNVEKATILSIVKRKTWKHI